MALKEDLAQYATDQAVLTTATEQLGLLQVRDPSLLSRAPLPLLPCSSLRFMAVQVNTKNLSWEHEILEQKFAKVLIDPVLGCYWLLTDRVHAHATAARRARRAAGQARNHHLRSPAEDR